MGSIPDAMWLNGNRVAIGNIPTGENIPAGALGAVLGGICIYLVDCMGSDILGGVIPGGLGLADVAWHRYPRSYLTIYIIGKTV